MRITISQTNLHVGDLSANYKKVLGNIETARNIEHANIIIFPELSVTGYPPEDLLLRSGFIEQVANIVQQLAAKDHGIDILISYPEPVEDKLFNRISLLSQGAIKASYDKKDLPNYGVFDEKRYFTPGNETVLIDMDSIPTALSICEDLWSPTHARSAAEAGAKLLINVNASPYHSEIMHEREDLLRQRVKETGMGIIYVNLVGGQDEVVFDGGSMVMDSKGEIVFRAPQFEEGLYTIEIKENNGGLQFLSQQPVTATLSTNECTYKALVLGVKDYVTKNGFKGAVIGLSGGIDSALTLAIAVDALGAENVEVLLMPSRFTSDMSNNDARQMAETLGVKYYIVPIEKPFQAFTEILEPIFKGMPVDVTEENIQARSRGVLLMAVSNKTGKIVLTTGNKSEMAVGYATLYGDMAGGFAPLKDVPKLLVYELSNWRNRNEEVIPQRIIDRPPSAELRPDQKDEDSLPSYEILDAILEHYIEDDQGPKEIIRAGFDEKQVHEVVRMVDRNEYKRRQAAPGVKITKRAFGRDRRYPITSGYKEY